MSEKDVQFQDDEITLKELILKIREFWKELWQNWWIIGLISVPFVLYMGYKAYTSEVTYPANLTFMVNKEDGSSLSAFSGILGTFGLGGGSKGGYNLDKMLQLLKSRKITEEVLFSEAEIDGRVDLIANHIITNQDTLQKWYRKPSFRNRKPDKLKDFVFKSDSLSFKDPLENAAVKRLLGKILGNENIQGFLSSSYNEDSGILSLKAESEHERLSILLANTYFEKLSEYYINQAIEQQQNTYDLVKHKNDSIYSALSSSEYNLARLIETSRNVFSETEQLKKKRLEREVQKFSLMYAESSKNLELADFTLKSRTPVVQLIDAPISPIKPNKESLLKSLVIGGFLGVFLGALFIVARKIYRDTMSK